jgi:hypothetical protein
MDINKLPPSLMKDFNELEYWKNMRLYYKDSYDEWCPLLIKEEIEKIKVGNRYLLAGEYVDKVNNMYKDIGDGEGQQFTHVIKVISVGKKQYKILIEELNKKIILPLMCNEIGRVVSNNRKYFYDDNIEFINLYENIGEM